MNISAVKVVVRVLYKEQLYRTSVYYIECVLTSLYMNSGNSSAIIKTSSPTP